MCIGYPKLFHESIKCMESSRRLWRRHCNQRIYLQYQQLLDSTLLEKSFFTPIWEKKVDMDRLTLLPVGWNWNVMYMWLLPNVIRPYLARPDFHFNAKWVHRSPKPQFISPNLPTHSGKFESKIAFFNQFSLIVLIMPHPTPIGIRHEVLALAHQGKRHVVTWVWLGLPSTAFYGGMMPLELWHQASLQGLLGRTHLVKTMLCWG